VTVGETYITRTYQASSGHYIRVRYEPLDEVVEKADRSIEKLRRGYRIRIEIAILQNVNIADADFLRLCTNADRVEIISSSPVNLAGMHLVFTDYDADEIFTSDVVRIKAEAKTIETVYNIPTVT
jgi:hypothetical protein